MFSMPIIPHFSMCFSKESLRKTMKLETKTKDFLNLFFAPDTTKSAKTQRCILFRVERVRPILEPQCSEGTAGKGLELSSVATSF